MSIIPPNHSKTALQAGKRIFGTMLAEMRQPAVMQVLANVGFDFVIIDNEHGGFSIESIAALSQRAVLVGLTPIVRVPDVSYAYVAQSLDAGAQGIMLPRITEAGQVQAAIAMMKFPPLGQRGNAQSRAYTGFQSGPTSEVLAAANRESLLVVQVENQSAVENLEAILALEAVDVIFIGPNDLSISLGTPGDPSSEAMQTAFNRIIETCQAHQTPVAIQANSLSAAQKWGQSSVQMLSLSSETGFIMQAGRIMIEAAGR